ncbi:MAG: endo-1,4-beta-xylanase [Treponema sp.]|nr:endo-1,4-beta-xylanase [Treponema sp.]
MKKILFTLAAAALLLFTVSCSKTTDDNTKTNTQTETETNDSDTGSDTDTSESQEEEEACIIIDGSKVTSTWALATISLSDFANKSVTVSLSAKMKVVNSGSSAANIMWQVNTGNSTYPTVSSKSWEAGTSTYTSISDTQTGIENGSGPIFYISSYGLTLSDLMIYLKDLTVTVTDESDSTNTKTYTAFDESDAITVKSDTSDDSDENDDSTDSTDWLSDSVPSLYETYKDYFEYIGFAVEYGNFGSSWGTKKELYYPDVQKGLAKHANTISLGNEFKPQFIFSWWGNKPSSTTDFTGSNGVTTKVPTTNSLEGLSRVDSILSICKKNGLKMRGHVLLWHSQTDDAFFTEDYSSNGTLVNADEMDARLEWYIKTILAHVADWEKTNNNGEHIIWAWDVINEVTSDGSTSSAASSSTDSDWLRTSGSKWYTVYNNSSSITNYYTGEKYKSYDFIINAFRFAQKYASEDIKLCYNDYGGLSGTSTSNKHQSQLRVVDLILNHKNDTNWPTRLDAMGLQSHYSVKNSASAFEKEIKDFIAKGIDVQITELDIATCDNYKNSSDTVGTSGKQFNSLSDAYAAFFKVFLDNRKTSSTKGIDSITIWGLNDEATWLNTTSQIKWIGESIQYPLLFKLINNVAGNKNTITNSDGTKTLGTVDLYDDGDSFAIKPAFTSVIQTAAKYSN